MINVVGAGLAGAEAACFLADRGHKVTLFEMRPHKNTPAHHTDHFAELVCSNSLRADTLENAAGLLKAELELAGSVILRCARATAVPAGGALAVDRNDFSALVTKEVYSRPLITVVREEVTSLPNAPAIVAAGPLCEGELAQSLTQLGAPLHFYDAAAPLLLAESLNYNTIFRASRYGRGEDYLNCPLNKEQYLHFVTELVNAQTAPVHGFEQGKVFEGCMPVEVLAARGEQALAFGPLKPVGLRLPTGERPYAVVQLRQDDKEARLYNMVGFQTHLRFPEQKRVFSLIPGLENAEFARYGVMHRNTFLRSPGLLDHNFMVKAQPGLFIAGQLSGVEGYLESAASGHMAARALHALLTGRPAPDFTRATALGALGHYVSGYAGEDFQPMKINFGILEPWVATKAKKRERYRLISERSLSLLPPLLNE